MKKDNRFLIITGLSGSGKTVVSRSLEDLGYYCIDNLPAKLIPNLVDLWLRREMEIEKIALVVDIREHGFLTVFPQVLKAIGRKITPWVVFLESSDETLVKRFSESRRPHPLSRRRSILDGVRRERKQLAGVKAMADEVIDTSAMSLSDLKSLLARRFVTLKKPKFQVLMTSFGYKHGLPMDSDLVVDTRFLPNPFYIDTLKNLTGLNRPVKDFIFKADVTQRFLKELFRFLDFLMPRFVEEGKSHVRIAVGCTGGRHRSVVVGEALKSYLKKRKYDINITHRDLRK
ncbi:MAG: RNase adapter RapZ [Candidatus Aminicenantes bacterium]|nr:RNase adapter RapZ [Candidatus Aminicenantes bacterium]